VDLDYIADEILPKVQELIAMKNSLLKRKWGFTMIIAIAMKHQEEGFENILTLFKIMLSMICDTNWKIRLNGVSFLKRYLPIVAATDKF
jgi:hypothetical protein